MFPRGRGDRRGEGWEKQEKEEEAGKEKKKKLVFIQLFATCYEKDADLILLLAKVKRAL